jgi:hypothetical protein
MFNQHLREMGPAAAAETVAGMFSLCADEDLVADLCCDLQLDKATATAIAGEIHKIRDGMTR